MEGLEQLGTDYVDFGFLHCVDEEADFDKLCEIGVLDYLKELKAQGVVRHIGFSSHTPSVANRILDTGLVDMMMFSINPAYDFEKGDEYGIGSVQERFDLFKWCEKEGVGISVMKPFFAGQLLTADQSPFGVALTHNQCPAGIDIGLVNKHYDLAQAGDEIAANHYTKLSVKADECLHCGHCESRCPFGVKQESRMEEIDRYFG